jgi:hypothetical protein
MAGPKARSISYIGVAASYMKTVDGKEPPSQTMLSMKPLFADGITGMQAIDHIDHLSNVLEGCGSSNNNIICLVGNNCAINQSMVQSCCALLDF